MDLCDTKEPFLPSSEYTRRRTWREAIKNEHLLLHDAVTGTSVNAEEWLRREHVRIEYNLSLRRCVNWEDLRNKAKTYHVRLEDALTKDQLRRMSEPVHSDSVVTAAACGAAALGLNRHNQLREERVNRKGTTSTSTINLAFMEEEEEEEEEKEEEEDMSNFPFTLSTPKSAREMDDPFFNTSRRSRINIHDPGNVANSDIYRPPAQVFSPFLTDSSPSFSTAVSDDYTPPFSPLACFLLYYSTSFAQTAFSSYRSLQDCLYSLSFSNAQDSTVTSLIGPLISTLLQELFIVGTILALDYDMVDRLRNDFSNDLATRYHWDSTKSQFRSPINLCGFADEIQQSMTHAHQRLYAIPNANERILCEKYVRAKTKWDNADRDALERAMADIAEPTGKLKYQVMDHDTQQAIVESLHEQADNYEKEEMAAARKTLSKFHAKTAIKKVAKDMQRMTLQPVGYESDASGGSAKSATEFPTHLPHVPPRTSPVRASRYWESARAESSEAESEESFLLVEDDLWDDVTTEDDDEEIQDEEEDNAGSASPRISESNSWSEVEMTDDDF